MNTRAAFAHHRIPLLIALQGYGSKALPSSSSHAAGGSGAGGGRSAGGTAAEQAAAPAPPAEAGGASGSGRARMWIDRWTERELAPGVWLVRYMELHQPFVGEFVFLCFGSVCFAGGVHVGCACSSVRGVAPA